MKCTRCGGKGVFYTRVVNMTPIKAIPDDGMCYRCYGSGVDPYLIDEDDVVNVITQNQLYSKDEIINLIMTTYNTTRKACCFMLNNLYKQNKIVKQGDCFTLRD